MNRSDFLTNLRSLDAPVRVGALLLLVLTASRIVLVAWYWDRVEPTGGTWFIFLQGLRFDIVLMGMLIGPALLAAPWQAGRKRAGQVLRAYLVLVTVFVFWIEMGTIPYIDQYDARPNYIYVEYLKYPREVLTMLFVSYGLLMLLTGLATAAAGWLTWRLTRNAARLSHHRRLPHALLLMPLIMLLMLAMIRSTTDHHPVNPSTVAFSTDSMVNQLPLNSPYTLIYAIYEQYRDS
ncbi:MAG: hypothetical protein KJO80_14220, partial [Gammaproteobacteria bacterium]|nr:hypothetical protein [Gammaproteobacteria bacterium]